MKKNKKYTYIMYDGKYYKIGQSTNPEKRVKQLKTGNPNIALIIYGDGVTEKYLHEYLVNYRISGEFFDLNEKKLDTVIKLIKEGEYFDCDKKTRMYSGHSHGKAVIDGKSREERLNSNWTISFGKYKGKKIKELHTESHYDYAKWFVKNSSGSKKERKYKAFKWFIKEYNKNN